MHKLSRAGFLVRLCVVVYVHSRVVRTHDVLTESQVVAVIFLYRSPEVWCEESSEGEFCDGS